MICILHGYLLEGSGSNLWTRAIIESLCREGRRVHLMAQENHPDRYPFIEAAYTYAPDGTRREIHRGDSAYAGCCTLHRPLLGDLLPVYVRDRYEEFPRAIPMVELGDAEIEDYLERNTRALLRIVESEGITAIHANHSVLMSTVAYRVQRLTGVPYAVMPHGSALEFAVKRDERFRRLAEEAMSVAGRIFVHGDEMRDRVLDALPALHAITDRFSELHLGVDTDQFEPLPRDHRAASVERMFASLLDTPRGRTRAQTDGLMRAVAGAEGEDDLHAAFEAARDFDGKRPDADLEEKLGGIRWEAQRTLLFVGRIISTKGIHGVIAALPLLLRELPDLRLVIVGHGPLREPLEALIQAMQRGDREMVHRIVERGRALEGSPEGEGEGTRLTQAGLFLDQLRDQGKLDDYFQAARDHLTPDRVIFTGYLTHRELHFLFPCFDAAVFPSVIKEAGPLVFLEALASGIFPLGTYFGGMRASIDSIADALPAEAIETMKLDADPARTVPDLVRNTPKAMRYSSELSERLNRIARERYDWRSVAMQMLAELEEM